VELELELEEGVLARGIVGSLAVGICSREGEEGMGVVSVADDVV
jgi:hypothetical protein